MIARIHGPLLEKTPDYVVVDAGGVGYRLEVTIHTFYDLDQIGTETALLVHTHNYQDGIMLFGFTNETERTMFRKLITISGIGPKLARNILSGIRVSELAEALRTGDLVRIKAVPGVGKKTAERILIELRGKDAALPQDETGEAKVPTDPVASSVVSALVNLGYKRDTAIQVMEQIQSGTGAPADTESLLRMALQALSK